MTDLSRLARAQRRAILEIDALLASRIVDAYAGAWQRLRADLDALTREIEQAGTEASPGWLLRQERLRTLERRIVDEVTQIAWSANGAITSAQWEVVHLAQRHARESVTAALGDAPVFLSFDLLPVDAIRAIVGAVGEGTPLSRLLAGLGSEAAASVKDALTQGVILGEGPATIARRVRSAFGGNAVRAVTLSRTETLRAYREGSRAAYVASGVVAGWRWVAAIGQRRPPCAFCFAQHGSVHPLNAPMATHPNCRCVASPALKKEFAGAEQDTATGPEVFAQLDADQQRAVLGKAKYAAYSAGAITLEDLAGTKRTREWGRVGWEKSLTSVLGAERTKEIIAGARSSP